MIRRHRFRLPGGPTFASFVLLTLTIACDQPSASGPAAPDIRFAPGGNGGGSGSSIEVVGVDPNEVEQGVAGIDLRISGSGFEQGASVSFELNGETSRKVTTNSATVVDPTEIIANVDVSLDAEVASYDIVVRRGPSKGVGSELLQVKENQGQGPFDPETPLSVTFDQTVSGPSGGRVIGDADSDGDGTSDAYVDGEDLAAILRSNGNLNVDMFDGKRNQPPARTVGIRIYTPETGLSDRGDWNTFINSNDTCPSNTIVCEPGEVDVTLRDMPVSTTAVGRAMIAFIWEEDGVEHRLKYGVGCESNVDRIPAERAYAMHPDPDTWIVWGTDATWCSHQINGNHPWVTVSDGARADFSITLKRLP